MGKSVFIIAAIITIFVFASVFFLVKLDESAKFGNISAKLTALYEEQQANKILESYLEDGSEESCLVYEKQISRQLTKIYILFDELERAEDMSFATSSKDVRRLYLLTNMALWVDLKNASEKCDLGIKPVLYFFPKDWHTQYGLPDASTCLECDAMVEQLEILKSQCPETRVFAFPAEDEQFEFVGLLKSEYNVSSAPAIVINGNVVYKVAPTELLKEWLDCS